LTAAQKVDVAGLIGVLGQSLISGGTPDPFIQNVGTGVGSVTSINGSGDANISVTGGPITGAGTLVITFNLNPVLSSVTCTTAGRFKARATTPVQITADQNNYNPGTGGFFRITTDASRNITGILAGADGDMICLRNAGSFNFVLMNQDGASAAANRIITGTGASCTYLPDETALLQYDIVDARWILVV
jgi:hypothetical protein